jgi:hypothetical protein
MSPTTRNRTGDDESCKATEVTATEAVTAAAASALRVRGMIDLNPTEFALAAVLAGYNHRCVSHPATWPRGLRTMSDFLLRHVPESRAGAEEAL